MAVHTTSPQPIITIRRKSEKAVHNRHPWLFSGAIAATQGDPEPGATVFSRSNAGAVARILRV